MNSGVLCERPRRGEFLLTEHCGQMTECFFRPEVTIRPAANGQRRFFVDGAQRTDDGNLQPPASISFPIGHSLPSPGGVGRRSRMKSREGGGEAHLELIKRRKANFKIRPSTRNVQLPFRPSIGRRGLGEALPKKNCRPSGRQSSLLTRTFFTAHSASPAPSCHRRR